MGAWIHVTNANPCTNGLPFSAAWREFPFCETLVLSMIPSRSFQILPVCSVAGVHERTRSTAKSWHRPTGDQLWLGRASSALRRIEFHDTWRKRHCFWDFTGYSMCWAAVAPRVLGQTSSFLQTVDEHTTLDDMTWSQTDVENDLTAYEWRKISFNLGINCTMLTYGDWNLTEVASPVLWQASIQARASQILSNS